MPRKYYFCCCRLNKKDYNFIWFSDEVNGVYSNSENKFPVSGNLAILGKYAESRKLFIKNEEPVFYDLDKLEETLGRTKFKVNCVNFLNAWNLFDDVSHSINENFNSDRKATKQIYEKLFWGNNLPAVTPEGKYYKPVWRKKEREIIRTVLLNGITIFRNNLKPID